MSALRNHKPLTNDQIDKLTNEGGVPNGAHSIIEKAGLLLACLPETGKINHDELAKIAGVDTTKDSSWLRARRALVDAGLVRKSGHGATTKYSLAPGADDMEMLRPAKVGMFMSGNRATSVAAAVAAGVNAMQLEGEDVELAQAPDSTSELDHFLNAMERELQARTTTAVDTGLREWSGSWLFIVIGPDAYEAVTRDERAKLDMISTCGRAVGMTMIVCRRTNHPQSTQIALGEWDGPGLRLASDLA